MDNEKFENQIEMNEVTNYESENGVTVEENKPHVTKVEIEFIDENNQNKTYVLEYSRHILASLDMDIMKKLNASDTIVTTAFKKNHSHLSDSYILNQIMPSFSKKDKTELITLLLEIMMNHINYNHKSVTTKAFIKRG